MLFATDKQTLDDLHIFGKHGTGSVYDIYNQTNTRGGAGILKDMFRYPLTDAEAINARAEIFRYFTGSNISFPFQSTLFDAAETYLANTDERSKLTTEKSRLMRWISADVNAGIIHNGVTALVQLLTGLYDFILSPQMQEAKPYSAEKETIVALLSATPFNAITAGKELSHETIASYDAIFRFRYRDAVMKILRSIYLLDVYLSVAKVAIAKKYVFPKALPSEKPVLMLHQVYHPLVSKAVPNSLHLTSDSNLLFLTGANMAGKSTFMKSVSIALYVAHMGFPVAAGSMEFSVLDGMYTTINLPDNLGLGASHFYAEVLRMKKIAATLSGAGGMLVVFDEMFRGTNVKDAYEATVAITAALAEKRNSWFIISTHIIEAGDVLKEQCDNIRFAYLPTRMNGNKPEYTYTLEDGITEDRHGMVIIRNEGIIEMLETGKAVTWNS